jgi:hypothetical protein
MGMILFSGTLAPFANLAKNGSALTQEGDIRAERLFGDFKGNITPDLKFMLKLP